FTNLGIYQGTLFVEPGKAYNLILPEKNEKEPADIVNPYFQEIKLYLGISNSDTNELNFNIRLFDNYFEDIIRSDIALKRENHQKLDTLLNTLDSLFSFFNHPYFNAYKEYKLAILRYLSYQRNFNYAVFNYFRNKPVMYNNMSYMEFFNKLFENFFQYYSQIEEGHTLYQDINLAKSIKALKETLGKNIAFDNDTLKELVILKGLHDAFFFNITNQNNLFRKQQLFQTLDSIRILTKIPVHKFIAQNIYSKATYLMQGTKAPEFSLYSINNKLFNLDNLKGKYIYIGFYSLFSTPCMHDLEDLKVLRKKHGRAFEIVTIFIDRNVEEAVSYIKEKDYKWLFLNYSNQPEILKQYKVAAYPTYYLIGPDGNLVLSPAPAPSENFENRFFEIIKRN
ncbi:MAG: TlpA family protein disulfide reductase, partial [Bacteroidia bacterium]|nr:TlpA family protein disulfide reductase [Bacteroidia bacterium]